MSRVDVTKTFVKEEPRAKVVVANTEPSGVVSPRSALIKELDAFENSLVSYDRDGFTDDKAEVILANETVKSKYRLKLNTALAINSMISHNGCKKEVSQVIDTFVKDFKIRDFARQIMYSNYYGKAVIRVYWNEFGRIIKTEGLNHAMFEFNTNLKDGAIGDLMYHGVNLSKKYPYNFIVIFNERDARNNFGQSDLKELYPVIMFWNLLAKIEARYFNKAVIPSYVVGYDTVKTGMDAEQEAGDIASALSNIENSSGVGIANLKSLYVLQENGQVSFNSTFERLKSSISSNILGSDLTDSKKNGTYAQAKVSSEFVSDNVKDLATKIQDFLNTLITWQVWAQFGTEFIPPKFLFDMSEPYTIDKFEFMVKNGFAISFSEASKIFPIPAYMDAPDDDVWRPNTLHKVKVEGDEIKDKEEQQEETKDDK